MARQLFTARHGGVSQGSYSSLNLGDHVGDDLTAVVANRQRLSSLLSVSQLQFMNQVHGSTIAVIDEVITTPEADALVTNQKGIALVVMVADCLPILLDGQSVIGAAHVGRKGMTNGVIANTVSQMQKLGATQISATIGPGICADCYEVSADMFEEISKEFPTAKAKANHLDLRTESARQLTQLGVLVSHIDICTLESGDHFSYRRDGKTGRQCGAIVL
jgi:YfiH family protein